MQQRLDEPWVFYSGPALRLVQFSPRMRIFYIVPCDERGGRKP